MIKTVFYLLLTLSYHDNDVTSFNNYHDQNHHHQTFITKRIDSIITNSESQRKKHTDSCKLFLSSSPATSSRTKLEYINKNSNDNDSNNNMRKVAHMEKYARLPVWPAWNGVAIFILSKILGNEIAAKIEDTIGGRVCPQFFFNDNSSPFLMLVHHVHSFAPWDILRYIQRVIFPEGFPAHPHRGFITLTYILEGGFVHRDSNGVKQLYGTSHDHKKPHSQWMVAGSGILHEEMWDINPWTGGRQELYQLWINLPSQNKLDTPQCLLLGGDQHATPIITNQEHNTNTIVLCGEYNDNGYTSSSSIQPSSSMNIFHVKLLGANVNDNDTIWNYDNIPINHQTVIIYVRKGSIIIQNTLISTHHTAFLTTTGTNLAITNANDRDEADFLLLSGEQLNEPIANQGSMVMNTDYEIQQAYNDYSLGKMGAPWDHTLSDDEWKDHVKKFPSSYR